MFLYRSILYDLLPLLFTYDRLTFMISDCMKGKLMLRKIVEWIFAQDNKTVWATEEPGRILKM